MAFPVLDPWFSLYLDKQVTLQGEGKGKGEVEVVGEGEEGANFVSRLEVLHVQRVPKVIPMGVVEGDTRMDENVVGVVEGLGNQMWNLTALYKVCHLLHVMCLLMVQ